MTRHKPVSADWSEVSAQLEEERGHLNDMESLNRLVHSLITSCTENNRSNDDKVRVVFLGITFSVVLPSHLVNYYYFKIWTSNNDL